MKRAVALFVLGVASAAAAGFLSPFWYLGFIPIAAGCVWSALNLVDVDEVTDGDA